VCSIYPSSIIFLPVFCFGLVWLSVVRDQPALTLSLSLSLSGAPTVVLAARIAVKKAFRLDNFGPRGPLLRSGSHAERQVNKKAGEQIAAVGTSSASKCIRNLYLKNITWALPGDRQKEKAATLERVQQRGVLRLTKVQCHRDPSWVLDVLHAAAPTLEAASFEFVGEEHLQALHAMPRLRRLELTFTSEHDPVLPALQHSGGLKWLRVQAIPPRTLVSLLRAHSASLDELWLHVSAPRLPEDPLKALLPSKWDDLAGLLAHCGLRVSRLVLWRDYHMPTCPEQVSPLRRLLPDTLVQCNTCDSVAWETF
ncbi:uncharacterized protein LOC117646356, partial [Thrips palmi]|uniref:Uncharacterized protein LOC117646356 n=1 Tax=Thrips palmi TaxID=161013 RepID=A0A6P8YSW9_THRPL